MDKIELLLEAERRGILPPERQSVLDEARKRGLVQVGDTEPAAAERNDLGPLGRGLNYARNLTDQAVQGVTFNLGDEIAAAGRYVGGQAREALGGGEGRAYSDLLAETRAGQDQFTQENPIASALANVAGGVAMGGQMAKSGLTLLKGAKPTIASAGSRGAIEGALYGAAYGAGGGEGVGDRAESAARSAALGGATGGMFGSVGGALARRGMVKPPSAGALREQAQAAYQAADDAGVVIKNSSFRDAVLDIQKEMAEEGIDQTLHPRAMAALQRMTDVGEDITLKGTEVLRRVVKSAAASPDRSERRLARIMTQRLDEFVQGVGTGDLVTGAPEAVKSLSEARGLWARAAKAEAGGELIEKAKLRSSQFSGSGYENALRTEFRALARNANRMRQFNKEEQAAIRKVAEGGPVGNLLRMVGRFAPSGVVSSTLSGGAGYALGGPVGMAALPAAGYAARQGATQITAGNARIAEELMRRGGPALPSALSPKLSNLTRALVAGSATQAPELAR